MYSIVIQTKSNRTMRFTTSKAGLSILYWMKFAHDFAELGTRRIVILHYNTPIVSWSESVGLIRYGYHGERMSYVKHGGSFTLANKGILFSFIGI